MKDQALPRRGLTRRFGAAGEKAEDKFDHSELAGAIFAIGKPFPGILGVGWLADGECMSRLNISFREPEPQPRRRNSLTALVDAILRGVVMGVLGSLALHVVGVLA